MASLREEVKRLLGTDKLTTIGGGGGCISSGTAYRTAEGIEVFVKVNNKSDAHRMFLGEEASLRAIYDTKAVICPEPIKVLDGIEGGGAALVMSYLNLSMLQDEAALGEALARLHMDNWKLLESGTSVQRPAVTRYGFDVATCCGYLPQTNTWRDDWIEFYCEKIDYQLTLLSPPDKQASALWTSLGPRIHKLFEGVEIRPSLLHGDLWSGNAGQTPKGAAVFDAASFYGHHEYDLGIAGMFGGFGAGFYKAYHKLIPKKPGHEERIKLYQLFHYMNHWNHFGDGYRGGAMSIMQHLDKKI